MMLTQAELKNRLFYDPETGEFRWLVSSGGVRAGSVAGGVDKKTGYRRIRALARKYLAHRLAWLYMTGEWPAAEIDHRNLNRDDNRWRNLREASHAENMRNTPRRSHNTSGVKGVDFHKSSQKWRARINVNGRSLSLGYFNNIGEATTAYANAAAEHHGEFARKAA